MRLYRRKAISDIVKEGFDRRYTEHDPVTACGKTAFINVSMYIPSAGYICKRNSLPKVIVANSVCKWA